jgi:hypothetical protein
MKVCYADESGTGQEPIATMVGILVDSQRMHVTKEHWGGLLARLSRIVGRRLSELHTCDFYAGSGVWRQIQGSERANVITAIFQWLTDRKHHVVFSSILKDRYTQLQRAGQVPHELNTLWRFMGFHLILAIQKRFQRDEKPKGNTILIFDNEERERVRFTDLIKNPPAISDAYYEKERGQARLDQIIDVPFFGDSSEVPLIQVADLVAFVLRRYAEIKENLVPARYATEPQRIDGWARMIGALSIGRTMMYPSRGRDELGDLFYTLAPQCIKEM